MTNWGQGNVEWSTTYLSVCPSKQLTLIPEDTPSGGRWLVPSRWGDLHHPAPIYHSDTTIKIDGWGIVSLLFTSHNRQYSCALASSPSLSIPLTHLSCECSLSPGRSRRIPTKPPLSQRHDRQSSLTSRLETRRGTQNNNWASSQGKPAWAAFPADSWPQLLVFDSTKQHLINALHFFPVVTVLCGRRKGKARYRNPRFPRAPPGFNLNI